MSECVLTASLMAVRPDPENGKSVIAVLPEGTTVILAGPVHESGLIDVECAGERLTVFYQDLQERSTLPAARANGI